MSYDKYTSPTLADLSLKKMAQYANNKWTGSGNNADISLYQCFDNLKVGVIPTLDIGMGEMLHNDRPIIAGVPPDQRAKNDRFYGAYWGNTAYLISSGSASGSLLIDPLTDLNAGAYTTGTINIDRLDGYSPRYYWHYANDVVNNLTGKTEQQVIEGFDAANDFENLVTGDSGSNGFQGSLWSSESGSGTAFSNPLKYVNEVSSAPNGFGNLSGMDVYSDGEADHATLYVDIDSLGGEDDVAVYVALGWLLDNVGGGNDGFIPSPSPYGAAVKVVWDVFDSVGTKQFDFGGFSGAGGGQTILWEGADIEDQMAPVHSLNVGRIEMQQTVTFFIQVTMHKTAGSSAPPDPLGGF